ncbi:MAG: hypothetical protein HY877_05425 [Deltaproteobacteria bacterium]|nr:hypothetical protein [Deltaproteobacteria bacterium]
MLKFFFDRFSKVVYAMEILGVFFTLGWLWKMSQSPPSLLIKILMGFYIVEYLLSRFFASMRWHKQAERYEGIELHFKKIMIPISYILAIVSGVGFFTGMTFLLWFAIFVMGVISYVNITLIYLHYKDKNKTPVNYYSHTKYIR